MLYFSGGSHGTCPLHQTYELQYGDYIAKHSCRALRERDSQFGGISHLVISYDCCSALVFYVFEGCLLTGGRAVQLVIWVIVGALSASHGRKSNYL